MQKLSHCTILATSNQTCQEEFGTFDSAGLRPETLIWCYTLTKAIELARNLDCRTVNYSTTIAYNKRPENE